VTSAVSSVTALGYNVIDTSATARSIIDGYGAKVIIYTGYDKNSCQWKVPDNTWQTQVLNLKDDTNVVGWFLADEPHPYIYGKCTSSAAQIKDRSDFLHANAPSQKAMIVVLDGSNACAGQPAGCEYSFYNEDATHADLIGLDPYVCSTAHPSCDFSKIPVRVNSAVTSGIPLTKIMPVYQAFGGDGYYLMPTAAQETQLLQTWDGLAPPGGWAGEYTYEWQKASAPDGLSNHPEVQAVFATHNGV